MTSDQIVLYATLGTAVAFIRLLGVMKLDVGKLIGLVVDRWKKRASRANGRLGGRPRRDAAAGD